MNLTLIQNKISRNKSDEWHRHINFFHHVYPGYAFITYFISEYQKMQWIYIVGFIYLFHFVLQRY